MYKVDCNRLNKQESKKRVKNYPYNSKTVRQKERNTQRTLERLFTNL